MKRSREEEEETAVVPAQLTATLAHLTALQASLGALASQLAARDLTEPFPGELHAQVTSSLASLGTMVAGVAARMEDVEGLLGGGQPPLGTDGDAPRPASPAAATAHAGAGANAEDAGIPHAAPIVSEQAPGALPATATVATQTMPTQEGSVSASGDFDGSDRGRTFDGATKGPLNT